jgi:hypothetical protein
VSKKPPSKKPVLKPVKRSEEPTLPQARTGLTTAQVIEIIRQTMGRHVGSEKSLYDALTDEASGWEMRLQELEAEEEDT